MHVCPHVHRNLDFFADLGAGTGRERLAERLTS
jgi:hypothetical protein